MAESHDPDVVRPLPDDERIDRILALSEGPMFETKRVGEKDNRRKIETVVAFSNTDGGWLVIGIEDEDKAKGRDRVYGIQENLQAVDQLRGLLSHHVTPRLAEPEVRTPSFTEVACTLRNGSLGSIMIVRVDKSSAIHSVIDGGTFIRDGRTNRQISAQEINELCMQRGTISVINQLVDVPFELLDTQQWREYSKHRQLSRPLHEAMRNLGLARDGPDGVLHPTRAAVLLFAEEPSGLLDSKCTVRVFHYRGETVEYTPNTSLVRPPKSIGGPINVQIERAVKVVLEELATGVHMGPLGFEIAQSYPVRVVREAITNAVLHRDYRLASDIHVRIFANRIEVESPGILPGAVTVMNLGVIGSMPRNRALVDNLRDFPSPPNLDAGEGVRMMRSTMTEANLYPPIFFTQPELRREAVEVCLFNDARPSIWDQVDAYLKAEGEIRNSEVRALLQSDDPIRASKLLRSWVDRGLLVVSNPESSKKHRRYRRPGTSREATLFTERLGK